MSYAETQDEIIRTRLRGRPSAGARMTSLPSAPPPRVLPTAAVPPAYRPAARERVAVGPACAQQADASRHDGDADADLAAARRLRYVTEVQQIVDAAGITAEQLRGHDKRRELVEVRRIVAAYLRPRGCTLPEIGRVLKPRPHERAAHAANAGAGDGAA